VKPQPTNDLMHIGVKSAALVAAVFVDFPKNKNVIFCTVRSKKRKEKL